MNNIKINYSSIFPLILKIGLNIGFEARNASMTVCWCIDKVLFSWPRSALLLTYRHNAGSTSPIHAFPASISGMLLSIMHVSGPVSILS